MENIIASDAAVYIGAALCPLPMAASAWGVAKLWITMIETVGRNPQVKKDVDTYGWVCRGRGNRFVLSGCCPDYAEQVISDRPICRSLKYRHT